MNNTPSRAEFNEEENELKLFGSWTLHSVVSIKKALNQYSIILPKLTINLNHIEKLDTIATWYLTKFARRLEKNGASVSFVCEQDKYQKLIDLVNKNVPKNASDLSSQPKINFFARIGIKSIFLFFEGISWLNFIGEVFLVAMGVFKKPKRLRLKYLFNIVEHNGYHALPLLGFLSFLIGVVLTYQIGLELRLYGANIFIINLLGLAILREFGPLLTAIIISGRTGSAYTAQLGLMKSNQEIDALATMGHSPAEFLILPRILGLILVMPLLTVWADIFGIFGGIIMAKAILGISYYDFLSRFPASVTVTTYVIGLIKAPVFALIIGIVGCFHGFKVTGSAESIGSQTTRSVVIAIFSVIIADALFSILQSWLGI